MNAPQQHEDPFGEARQKLLEGLAVAATIAEALARWRAVRLQSRPADGERSSALPVRDGRGVDPSGWLREQAEFVRLERGVGEWLDTADLAETVRLWRTAAVHAEAGNRQAQQVLGLAQDRVRLIHPLFMDSYDRHRVSGLDMAEAMAAAAYEVWEDELRRPRGRAHGREGPASDGLRSGANGRALPSGELRSAELSSAEWDELDAAVRREVYRLAGGVDPRVLDAAQRQWRASGQPRPAAAAGLLAAYARQLREVGVPPAAVAGMADDAAARSLAAFAAQRRRTGVLTSGTRDDPGTAVDEHHAGLVAGSVAYHAADHDEAGAAQRRRMGQAFTPLVSVTVTNPLADKQPATVLASTPHRGRTR